MRRALHVLALVLAAGSVARASPMEDSSLGGAVFTGPTQGHASSFFANPAALGMTGRGWHVHLGGNTRLSSLSIDRLQVGDDNALESGESITDHTLTPSGIISLYGSFRDGKARFGASIFTPTVERFPSGESGLGYHSNGGQLIQGMLTFTGSLRWGKLTAGLGFSLGYSSLRLKFARDSVLDGGSDAMTGTNSDCDGSPCGYENPAAREQYDINVGNQASLSSLVSLENISISVGAIYQLAPKTWISLGYVALPGAFETLTLSGTATIKRAPRDGGQTETAGAEIGFKMAQMAIIGFRRPAFGAYNLVTDLRWQDWSRHSQFDIRLFGGNKGAEIPEWMPRNRGMKDVWRFSVGLESDEQEVYRFGARLRLETSAVDTNDISPMQVAGSNIALATGTELRLSNHWVFSVGYELSFFPTIDVKDSAFDPREQVACVDAAFDFDTCSAARNGRALSTAAGRYSRLQHGMVLSFRYDSL